MQKTEVYFENQRAVITQHLNKAKSFILVAMAWFTDKTLFDLLLKKSKEGIPVYVLIQDDEINSTSDIIHDRLNSQNGELHLLADEKKLMHHKFCVIDGYVVLHGSYNWTYQAINNHENLTVTEGDLLLAARFVTQFFKIRKPNPLKKNLLPAQQESIDKEIIPLSRNREKRNSGLLARMQERKRQAALKQAASTSSKPDDSHQPSL